MTAPKPSADLTDRFRIPTALPPGAEVAWELAEDGARGLEGDGQDEEGGGGEGRGVALAYRLRGVAARVAKRTLLRAGAGGDEQRDQDRGATHALLVYHGGPKGAA